ncbi:DUF1942 domain-containing protein [Mycobacterium sp.]|uniref:DUF1942 domain-containing protein n=1 Tax=Mycobacterium sp. TaxID=1785 RepID=UPI002BAD5731|nr:DUF1942 domain-containing protein [Mycobacterium sp.]HKP39596.1 DUF1942 domain-containing protein [Mycobacterium sp.]
MPAAGQQLQRMAELVGEHDCPLGWRARCRSHGTNVAARGHARSHQPRLPAHIAGNSRGISRHRVGSGANDRVIGGTVPGKLYFDVVGDVPNSVVHNDGVQDLLTWIPGPREGGTRP